MKIAIVHDQLISLGGAERVLREVADIYPKAPIFTLIYDAKKTEEMFKKREIQSSNLQKKRGLVLRKDYLLRPFYPFAIESLDLTEYDLILAFGNAFAKGVIRNPKARLIYYCHSPMGYLWHWYQEYKEEHKIKSLTFKLIMHFLRIWDQETALGPDLFLANSLNVQKRIKKYYQRDSLVLYPPVDLGGFKIEKNPLDYFLIVSRLSRYKKIDLAIKAFSKLKLPLLIVGEGEDYLRLKKMARPFSNIELPGRKPDDVVARYYANCRAFIFPGEEDFGIAPVEAMACGRPVIAFNAGGAKETVVEGVNGIFFDEPKPESLITAVEKFQKIEKEFNPFKIRESVQRFDRLNFRKKFQEIISNV